MVIASIGMYFHNHDYILPSEASHHCEVRSYLELSMGVGGGAFF